MASAVATSRKKTGGQGTSAAATPAVRKPAAAANVRKPAAAAPKALVLDTLLAGNRRYVKSDWDPADKGLATPPTMRLAVVACMDTRHNVEKVLGLRHGDAKVIRNAGNLIDDGTLRSLVVAAHLLGVRTVAILGHTKCGMTLVGRGEFRIARSIAATTDVPIHEVMRPDFQRWLGGFVDAEENVRRSVQLVATHPLMPKGLSVIGLLYDNATGMVSVVDAVADG